MRNFSIGCFTALFCLIFVACKKNDSNLSEKNSTVLADKLAKVKPWLDKQKAAYRSAGGKFTSYKIETIDLLNEYLRLDEASIEEIDQKTRYLSIPIKDAYLEKKGLDKKLTTALLLNFDPAGNIRGGNLVYFHPADGRKHGSFPQNTFKNMFSKNRVEFDGMYKMLSVGGIWASQNEVKNNRLFSIGVVSNKPKEPDVQYSYNCIDWYLVTTRRYDDGTTTTTYQYLYTVCGDDCGNPDPSEPHGRCEITDGGGSANSDCTMSQEEASNLISAITGAADGGGSVTVGPESAPDKNGEIKKPVIISVHQVQWHWGLGYSSTYALTFTGVIYKTTTNSLWKWKTLAYSHMQLKSGGTPVCLNASASATVSGPVISGDKRSASFQAVASADVTVICLLGYVIGTDPVNLSGIYDAGLYGPL